MHLFASIPSPSSGSFDIGPLTVHMYGLMLLLAIAVATYVAGRRWVRLGGDWDLIVRCAVWGVAFGIVGARLYHLATSWKEVPDAWWGPFAIWKGGLGVWGGIAAGCIAGAIVARRAGVNVGLLADCLAPGLLLAQGVGRLGNYWNQELFGKPTNLPWGLEIETSKAFAAGYTTATTFHPTFLYELLWNVLAAAILVLVIERTLKPRPPGIFAAYVALYCFGRFWIELLRVDPAHEIGPFRVNNWVALVGFVLGTAWFVHTQRRGVGKTPRPRRPVASEPPMPSRQMSVPRGRVRRRR